MDREHGNPDGGRNTSPLPQESREEAFLKTDPMLWRQFAEAETPETYYRSWLALQCQSITDVSDGVVVLGPPDTGPFAPVAFWPAAARNRQHLAEVAERGLIERHGLVLKREVTDLPNTPASQRYHVAYPIHVAGRLYGVVALDIDPRPEPQLQAVMRQLQWGAGWLEVWFRRQQHATSLVSQTPPQMALELVATVLEHDRFQAAATACVTELATRLECDRVSLGFVRRGRVHVRAMSHSAQIGKKANLTRALEAAMDEAIDQETTLVYPARAEGAFQIIRAHEALSRQHGAGALCSVPLSRNGSIFGALTLERPADAPFDAPAVALCEAIGSLMGPILEVQKREDRWLFTKAMASLSTQLGRLLGPHHMVRKLVVFGLVGLCVFFAKAKTDYHIAATTVLEPAIRRTAVAPFDGFIASAAVRAGDLVAAGEALCTLEDRDLKLERLRWLSQREQYRKHYQMAMAQREAAQARVVQAQIAQAEAELALVEDKLSRTRVAAPFDGIVVVGDLSQSIGAPVKQGEVLFEVATLDAYRVILQIDERDIAEVTGGQHGYLLLSALPIEPLPFAVQQVTPVSTTREGRNYFRVEAQLESRPVHLRPGMEGVGKITLEQRLLLWIWTHRAVDWLRLKLWTWWP